MLRILAILTAILGCIVTFFVAHQLTSNEREAFEAQLNERAGGVLQKVETTLKTHMASLDTLAASWATRLIPVRPEWETDVSEIMRRHPGFSVCELLSEKGRVELAHPRDHALTSDLGKPRQITGRNQAAQLGFSQSIALPQPDNTLAFRIFVPMARDASQPAGIAAITGVPGTHDSASSKANAGFVSGVFVPAKALAATLSDKHKTDFVQKITANDEVVIDSASDRPPTSTSWPQSGLSWRCQVQPAANLQANISILPLLIRGFGTALSLLLGLALWMVDLANRRKRTAEIANAKMRLEMTERLKTSDKLRVTEAELRRAQRMEVLGKLTGGIAHEFNNLFCTVHGFQSLALNALPADSDVRSDLECAAEAAGQASDLAGYLLEYSRSNVDTIKPVALNPVMERFDHLLQRVMGQEYVVDMELDPDVRGTILTSLFDFQQTLMDLALLAKEHMPEEGKLSIRTATDKHRDTNGTRLEEDRLIITFHLPVNRDERGEFETLATNHLKAAEQRLHRIGGTLSIENNPHDALCTFRLSFPNVGPAAEEDSSATQANEHDLAIAKGTHILLVEDDPRVLDFATRILQCMGCNVTSAETPTEALARAHEMRHIDLLVTDIALPGVAGTELYDQLKQTNPSLRCLFVSGHEEDELRQSWLRDREDPVLQKPFTLPSLSRAVASLIETAA